MEEVARLQAQRQVHEALAQRNGPSTESVHGTPIGGEVLIWRTHANEWQGLYKLLGQQDETCILQLPSGLTAFRSTAVKPYHQTGDRTEDLLPEAAPEQPPLAPAEQQSPQPASVEHPQQPLQSVPLGQP